MDLIPEVIVVSESSEVANSSILDLKSGSVYHTIKDCPSSKKCLSFIGQDYIISAIEGQPTLRVWVLNRSVPDVCNMVIPGKASALAVSSCGLYCVVGIECKFYVWEVATGTLLTTVEHHSKPVTCIKFSADGSHLITAGKDGMVLVWLLSQLVSASESAEFAKPHYVWLDHASEVTDVHVGSSSIFAQVATVSKDMTCRIYDLEGGRLLTTVFVDFAITAVTMDEAEYFLILGSPEGNIYRVNLFAINESEVQYNSTDKKYIYVGHTKEITCLSVSAGGKLLVSGSEDGELKVWDLMNFTCIRKHNFQGSITNAFITLLPPGLKNESSYFPRVKVSIFNRQYENNDTEYVTSKIQPKKLSLWHLETPSEYFDQRVLNYSEDSLNALNRNNLTQKMMSAINHQMYSFALSETYTLASSPTSSPEDSD